MVRPNYLWLMLGAIVLASLAIRILAFLYWGTGTIESEGAEYAKIADNLRSGAGFVGIVLPGPQVQFPPLFPWLIACVSFLTGDTELAGRVVSLIFGALLPLPVFGIASRLFNRTVGMIAAALATFYPLSIYLSFMVLSEGPYATLLLTTIYLVIRALQDSTVKGWLFIGAMFGLCYLLRVEGFVPLLISMVFALTATRGRMMVRLQRAGLAAIVFLFVAMPEIVYIYHATGKVALETKSTNLSYMAARVLAAEKSPGTEFMSSSGLRDVPSPAYDQAGSFPWEVKWAYYGIDSDLKGTGSVMRPWADIAREEHVSLKDMFRVLIAGLSKNLPVMFAYFSSAWMGAPLLPALALLGALRRPWRRPQASARLFVTLVAAAPLASTFLVLWYADPRYYFILIPFLCIWAANGLFEVGLWIKASSLASGWNILVPFRWVPPVVLGVALVISPIKKVKALYEFADSAPPFAVDKKIGQWIAGQQSRPIRVMDVSLPLSYHAGASQLLYFPYTSGDLALRYLDAAKPDYIVLRRGEQYTRYYEEWLTQGIPSQQAERLRLPALEGSDKFVIFRWHSSGS